MSKTKPKLAPINRKSAVDKMNPKRAMSKAIWGGFFIATSLSLTPSALMASTLALITPNPSNFEAPASKNADASLKETSSHASETPTVRIAMSPPNAAAVLFRPPSRPHTPLTRAKAANPTIPKTQAGEQDAPSIMTSSALANFPSPEADIIIPYGNDQEQFGELRLPAGEGPHPVMMFIHGGCWLAPYDIKHVRQLAKAFTDEGIATWTIEFRRVGNPGGAWPGTFEDVSAAGDFLPTIAQQYNLDMNRFITAGHSAGGHLALWYANRPDDFKPRPNTPNVKGVLALAPAADLAYLHETKACGSAVDKLMLGGPDQFPDRYKLGSAIDRLPQSTPQHVILGLYDDAWTPGGMRYVNEAVKQKAPITLTIAKQSGHFEMIDPRTSTWDLVLKAAKDLLK